MAFIDWNDTLKLGVRSIDQQHQQLVALINQLHEAMSQRRGTEALGEILDELVKYTSSHFAYEEQIFKQHGYRHGAEHMALHLALTKQVLEYRDAFRGGRQGLTPAVLNFLSKWLTDHILAEDEKYVRFFLAKGVK